MKNWRKRLHNKQSNPAALPQSSSLWNLYTLEELRLITNDFSEENCLVGNANSGGTYTGLLPDGSKVAVKRLKWTSYQDAKKFYSALDKVTTICHSNLVDVIGGLYEDSDRDRYIVYEYIENGCLDKWLHDIPVGGKSLDWAMRMKAATTLAQGIAYLHEKEPIDVFQVDIRASNIFLDEDFGAHLLGVGFVPWEATDDRVNSNLHQAPEFRFQYELSAKCDVYSFGVLLLELVSGCRADGKHSDRKAWHDSLAWAGRSDDPQHCLEILDSLLSSSSSSSSQVPEVGVIQAIVSLAYDCTQHVPSTRPSMSEVVHQLQNLQT